MKFKNYVKVRSLEEAYALNQKKSSRVLGGTLWMRQSRGQFGTAIDLSGLGLDQIEETAEEFRIGCMTTLRQLELHEGLQAYTAGAVGESVRHIVGVQFRNLATVGGSIFGRFGFSDVLTMFLALDTYVELYPSGQVRLEEFAEAKRTDEILVRLIVKKHAQSCVYLSQRNTKTDFPVLTCAAAWDAQGGRIVIGAAPSRAKVYPMAEKTVQALRDTAENGTVSEEVSAAFAGAAKELAAQVETGSNMRASAEYRTHLAEVLTRRALAQLAGLAADAGEAEVRPECTAGDPAAEKPAAAADNAQSEAAEAALIQPFVAVSLVLNGKKITAEVPADQKLFDFLRERGCWSVKCGCETSNCGLCTVLLDGRPVLSCSMLAVRADGHCIDTMEGLQKEAEEFGRFVAQQGAEQCGFCNPGMIMNAIAMFRELPDPTDAEIREYLAGNLCRCSGYEGQMRAIREFMAFRAKK